MLLPQLEIKTFLMCRITPGKHPSPHKCPLPNFDSFAVFIFFWEGGGFEVFRVTAYHAKFLHNKNTSRSTELTYTKAQSF